MIDPKNMVKDAISYLFDKYGSDQIAELHLEIDNMPGDLFLDLMTHKLQELRPELFDTNSGD